MFELTTEEREKNHRMEHKNHIYINEIRFECDGESILSIVFVTYFHSYSTCGRHSIGI